LIGYSHTLAVHRETTVAIRIVRLGTDRLPGEGIRIGTVRRPPRGVPKTEYASKNFYDVWLPMLAPSPALVKQALASQTERDWNRFVKKYRLEMSATNENTLLNTLAALSRQSSFSIGCYCADESRCHRSILRQLLAERGADLQ
jgi:uncharacterized protein YeaO (DUF488 family)